MSREVTVEELAANLREHIAEVQQGETLTIVADGKAIVTMQPTVAPRRGVPYPFRDFKVAPLEKPLGVDPVGLLIEERDRERSGKKYGL